MQRCFESDLALSESPEIQEFWIDTHKRAFKGLQDMEYVEDLTQQAKGIDRLVYLTSGRTLKVEEKTDFTHYPNIAFEEYSGFTTAGWAEKELECDLFAYSFYHQGITYYFDYPQLSKFYHTYKKAYPQRTVAWSDSIVRPIPVWRVCHDVRFHAIKHDTGDTKC